MMLILKRYTCLFTCLTIFSFAAKADFTVSFDQSQFTLTDTYNRISSFEIDINLTGTPSAGSSYDASAVTSIDYRIQGVLPDPTPSGFSGFLLIRTVTGDQFRALSGDASIAFTISASADLSDGLQLAELDGTSPIFSLNLREFNQTPGRYHPPVFTLNSDGTGRLQNANNKSTVPNPAPPIGSGLLVDVTFGEEYIADLSFTAADVTISAAVTPVEPNFQTITQNNAGAINISWNLGSYQTVDLERSVDLSSWIKVLTDTSATTYTETVSDNKAYFRLASPQ